MLIRRNIFANYVSSAYVAGVSILTVPLYVRYMGTEAFGLIGFYTLLQAWFQLLDAGLSTTLARESSRYSGGGDAPTLLRLRRVLERIFFSIGVSGALAFFFFADAITLRWLQVGELPFTEVINSVQLMGVIIASRWVSCLYRGVITGFEQQVWLGSFNVCVATARFLFCLPVIIFVDASPTMYFSYQAFISLLESLILYWQANKLLPKDALMTGPAGSIRTPLKFATGVAFTSIVWVLVTQVDKLLLSKLLPLSAFGEYSLAVLLAGGINLLAAPIGAALLPRLTTTAATADENSTRELYARYTQVTCLAMFPAAFTLYTCATPVLLAWTGNEILSRSSSTVLGLYSLGNAIMGVVAFAYYIQYAKGNIRLHLIGNAVMAAIYLPFVFWVTHTHGAAGAAAAWLLMNAIYLAAWVPLVHRVLVPGLHVNWMLRDVLPVSTGAAIPTILFALFTPSTQEGMGRWSGALVAFAFFLVSLAGAAAGSSILRNRVRSLIRNRLAASPPYR